MRISRRSMPEEMRDFYKVIPILYLAKSIMFRKNASGEEKMWNEKEIP